MPTPKSLFLASAAFFLLCSGCLAASKEPGWTLVFASEFDSPKDLEKWNVIKRSQNANAELQCYVPEACSVKNGCLEIKAEKKDTSFEGRKRHYTSGLINTLHKLDLQYGRFDMRFKVPKGKGYWPAFWLLPSSEAWPPEIDWMEILGHEPDTLLVTNHWGEHKNGNHPMFGEKIKIKSPDFSQDFHTLSGRWNKEEMVCYLDGKKVFYSKKGVPHEKMYVIVNLAIGGDLPGNPDESTKFPGTMFVDYVRVYKPVNGTL